MTGSLVISLDFELLWGVRDHATRGSYGANILGGRKAIPRMLDLFARHGIRATWATVGFVFCESREELFDALPPEELRPRYDNPALSNYRYLDEVGKDEAADPWYFGKSLVRKIADTPGQEIGTHTLSHCYCLESGFTPEAFDADLSGAKKLASRQGIDLQSVVFPRNQYADAYLDVCRRQGLKTFRGNPQSWAYRPTGGSGQTRLRRALRLADAYSGVLGSHIARTSSENGLTNVPASRFLRPCAGKLAPLHPLHIRTICRGMTRAARSGSVYHLWWHPHNFGKSTEENITALQQICMHFERLRSDYNMCSLPINSFMENADDA
ncbi:polysaccharide deacetylase family protein [Pseudogemmobacter bohemicus]|uniref:polysaccharide deacetylase family protein n=1 Tax=Pseudogemmobacter bohemicus TaxID=2250708 RepID=UPI000DD41544|nr:polysaccharide deacetylase family protein [Pseudogemmobacter bohemicus]